jgi:crossover junction endodeoxyribonuclease RuvC
MQNKKSYRVLGIDPGYDRVGVSILDRESNKFSLLYSKCIVTNPKNEFYSRLNQIAVELRTIIEDFNPDLLAIETLFLNKNQKTAMRVAEARGVICHIANERGLLIQELSPLETKMAITGDGRSDKGQIMKMVRLMIKLDDKKRLDDEYDAIAIGLASTFPQNVRFAK